MTRRTFFSFHYDPDCWRAWNVRNCWVVRPADEESRGFFDSSVFEASKRQGDENLKRFLRQGLENTSVTCVLAGAATWTRRWVRYEIARSVVKGNGLLTVHINGVRSKDKALGVRGPSPLDAMGVYSTQQGIFLAEWSDGKWVRYLDHTVPIPAADLWFPSPSDTGVIALSRYAQAYDFATNDGRNQIGGWIERAAVQAGR